MDINGKKKKETSYIAKFVKVKSGKMYGNFLRPTVTKNYNGFVYKYPNVVDVYPFYFNQIKKKLIPPENYGRGLFKFNIHVKNL